ncbi:MAG: NifU family protein [Candidatus Cloacimonadota bacterium]|nr:NifU family protein [Candidatus Cloacimonadota bacterium]
MELKEKVEKSLNKIRPMLIGDSGDVKLISVSDDGVVSVKLQGACRGCPFAEITLKYSIEKKLKEEIPEIKTVKAV